MGFEMAKSDNKKFQLLVFDWDGTLADSEACILDAMDLAVVDAACRDVVTHGFRMLSA